MSINTTLGVISALLHPTVDLLHLEAVPGNPHAGGLALNRVRGLKPVDAHGLFWNVVFAPAGYGLTVTQVGNLYDRDVIEISEFEQLLDLTLARSDVFRSNQAQGYHLFVGAVPVAIEVQLPPGLTIDLSWLVFF
jgi:hypothetical protein